MTRWVWLCVGLWCTSVAFAGPGFDGVGDRGPMPRFERGPGAEAGMKGRGEGTPMMRDVLEREQAILDMLAEHDPGMLERLQRLKERDPHAYTAQLVGVARRMERLRQDPEARERFEKIRTLERQIRAQASELVGLSNQERAEARESITGLVQQLFAAKQQERRAQLADLRIRIERLEEDIAERDTQRDQRIEEYIDQLMAERVEL